VRVPCSWCAAPCQLSEHDEDGDPCCESCARLAGLEYATLAAERHYVSPQSLRQHAVNLGLVGNRQRPETWAAVAAKLRRTPRAAN